MQYIENAEKGAGFVQLTKNLWSSLSLDMAEARNLVGLKNSLNICTVNGNICSEMGGMLFLAKEPAPSLLLQGIV